MVKVSASSILLVLLAKSSFVNAATRVIYGEDDRLELFDSKNDPKMVELARSTAIVVKTRDLTRDDGRASFQLPKDTFGDSMELCTEEPFKEQPNPGFCSSFLVGEDMIATAGHCIPDEDMCAGVSFVFDFGYRTGASEEDPTLVPEANVYKCTSVVSVKYEGGRGSDYSIVKVDRPVMGRQPLKLNRDLALAVGDGVTVIGNPSGLPTKIASNANVRKVEGDQPYFIANLDTYGGNSGSAVFNTTTGMVEGILVRGETDFIPRGSCYVSNRCADDACRGEDVTKTSEFTEFVPVL